MDVLELTVPETVFADGPIFVAEILTAEGDRVEAGQVVLEIETGRLLVEVHSPETGRVASVLVREGQQVRPGQVLLRLQPQQET